MTWAAEVHGPTFTKYMRTRSPGLTRTASLSSRPLNMEKSSSFFAMIIAEVSVVMGGLAFFVGFRIRFTKCLEKLFHRDAVHRAHLRQCFEPCDCTADT